MFEPAATADDIKFTITIHVGLGQPFMFDPAFPAIDFGGRPGLGLARISGDFGEKEATSVLVPVDKFSLAVAIKIAEHFVVMFGRTAILDQAARPAGDWVKVGVRILPPPKLVTP